MRRNEFAAVFLAIIAFLAASFSLSPAAAIELPALTGRVVDNAGIIDDATEALLVARLEAFEQKSSDQIVVVTIDTLGGEPLEAFANRLFREWALGQAGEDNGILLLVVHGDRKMRIEVGYGLEGTVTDLHSKLIIENTMVPAFREGDFAGGISRAVDDIILVLEGNGAELEERAERNQDSGWQSIDPDTLIFGLFFLIWGTLFFGGFAMAILPPIFGRKIGPNRYKWLGMEFSYNSSGGSSSGGRSSSSSSSGSSWSSSSSSSSGFSGGGGSSGGGGASGSW